MGKKKSKKNKEKVVYYDDNSTIVDMSNVPRMGQKNPSPPPPPRRKSTFGEKWKTYWSAVRMMLFPMFIVLLGLTVLYLIIMLLI